MNVKSEDSDKGTVDAGLTRHTLGGLAWILSSSWLKALLQIGVVAVLARILTPEDFGLMAAAMIVIGLADISSMMGIGSVIIQRAELTEEHVTTGFAFGLLFGVVLFGVMLLISGPVAAFFDMPPLEHMIRILGLIFPIRAVSRISGSLIQRKLHYRKMAGVDVAAYLVGYGGVGIALALAGYGVWALVWATLASAIINSMLFYVLQPHKLGLRIQWSALKDLLYLGTGFSTASLFNYAARQGDNLVVGRWLGPSALGIYGQAYSIMETSNSVFGNAINTVFFPAFAKIQHQKERMANAYQRGMTFMALVFLPISITGFIASKEIVDVLLGSQWGDVVLPLQILLLGQFFRIGHKVSGVVIRGCGAVYRLTWRQGAYALIVIGGAFIGKYWGVVGVAVSTSVALAIFYILLVNLSNQLVDISWLSFVRTILPGLLLAVVVGVEMILVRNLVISLTESAIILVGIITGILLLNYVAFLCIIRLRWVGNGFDWMIDMLRSVKSVRG